MRRPITIAILSYDRPHYLTQVLDSLAPQLNPLDQVYLFQDGAWNPHSGATKTDQKLIEECCMHFSRIIPEGKIIQSQTNLGIAGNYRRADESVFVENEAPMRFFSKTISFSRPIICRSSTGCSNWPSGVRP